MALQRACDAYMRSVQQYPPSVAPNYPCEWLLTRSLTAVQHYQDPVAYAAAAAALPHRSSSGGGGQLQQGMAGGSVAGAPGTFSAAGTAGPAGGGAAAAAGVGGVTTWWDTAAAGLRCWYATTRITYATDSETTFKL